MPSRASAALARHRGLVKRLVQLAILAVIVAAAGGVAFVEYSAKPSFCLNCHIMEPYYESWASSSHRDVACIKCHYAPGIKAEAMGKMQAANQVVKYVTGAYGMKPWAEIEDAACLRSGCHVEPDLESDLLFRGVAFNHAHHLGELRRGKQLRCTSCHSQIVQGEHVTVTEATCYLCHFKDRPAEHPIAECVGCHVDLPRTESDDGVIVDHPQYVADLVSCRACHDGVASGSGAAVEARCQNCHNEPERLAEFENTTLLHRVHIAERNVECTQCHLPIEHRVTARVATTFDLDCGSCHRDVHRSQQLMLAGRGGHGVDELPSAMYLANVSCTGCHELTRTVAGHEQVQAAGEAPCLSCHGLEYANMLPAWQRELERKTERVDAVRRTVATARSTASVRSRRLVDSLLAIATENVELVRVGGGAHNIAYADELLRAALAALREAVRVGRLPVAMPQVDLGLRISNNDCLRCHLGVEREEVLWRGERFDHDRHVLAGGLECAECHTSLDEHPGTTLQGTASCDNCHHPRIDPLNCATCHQGPGGAPETVAVLAEGDFSHADHAAPEVACRDCHTPPAMAPPKDCQSCHDVHHEVERDCLACHRGGALADHEREDHVLCVECHDPPADRIDRWTNPVCLSCHAELTEHYPEKSCAECHKLLPMSRMRGVPPIPRDTAEGAP